jgi:pyruvyltransferase
MIDPRTKDSVYVANQIKECRHLYSASLHGLIVADALGIPNTWVVSKKHAIHSTAEIKFLDYFLSVQRPYVPPITFHELRDHEKSIRANETLSYAASVQACKEGLLAAFPKHLKA